jgi:TRAP-type C4-dicarboxylate transport system permease small subunit
MTTAPSQRSAWRRLTAGYARLLTGLLAASVAVLVIPVSLQIFSRYTELIPAYIWTEEMARFLFVWMIMLGAMLGVRESSHFVVDVWPRMGSRAQAVVRIVSNLFVLVAALAFVWWGIEFTHFAVGRISELAELPLWLIHVAWPLAGVTWIVFLGEQFYDDLHTAVGRAR